ncbi:MAG: thioredoxin domain-containing protein [Candidatus Hydrogenedentes bacterium]|nr:thioredoxin domain-containing protein [Burkholderiales bacterium]MCC6142591.1 thioredoxin domain-containing protein [Candidatus Hydrogenedentota bacterium]
MSRKSKRNQPTSDNQEPQAPENPPAGRVNRIGIFVGAVVVLLLAFAGAALFYKGEKAQSAQTTVAKNQPALVSELSPTFGNPDAKVHIVEFFDPACETCATFFPHVKKLMLANPDKIRLSLRHVTFHKGSEHAVKVLEAARSQGKYLPTLEALYASQDQWAVNHEVRADLVWNALGRVGLDLERLRKDSSGADIAQRMERDMADARALGVTKTPEFFVNGRPLPRFGLEELQSLVKEELRGAYP